MGGGRGRACQDRLLLGVEHGHHGQARLDPGPGLGGSLPWLTRSCRRGRLPRLLLALLLPDRHVCEVPAGRVRRVMTDFSAGVAGSIGLARIDLAWLLLLPRRVQLRRIRPRIGVRDDGHRDQRKYRGSTENLYPFTRVELSGCAEQPSKANSRSRPGTSQSSLMKY